MFDKESRNSLFYWLAIFTFLTIALYALAYLMVIFVAYMAQKSVENGAIVAAVYTLGILLGLFTKPLFLEMATGKPFGIIPSRIETKLYRTLMYAFVSAPHAVFFAWGAAHIGWFLAMPRWSVSGIALISLVLIAWLRSNYRAKLPIKSCTCDLAEEIDFEDPIYQEVAHEVKNGQLLEAIKCLRHKKGLDTQCAIHTVRKIRFLKSRSR